MGTISEALSQRCREHPEQSRDVIIMLREGLAKLPDVDPIVVAQATPIAEQPGMFTARLPGRVLLALGDAPEVEAIDENREVGAF